MNRTFSPVLVERFSMRIRSAGTPQIHRHPGEEVGLGLVPEAAGDCAAAPGEDEERRAALEEQLRSSLGDDRVVAAEDKDGVSGRIS